METKPDPEPNVRTELVAGVTTFFTIILIPLTFSITQGILWGFITHAGLYTLAGRGREVGAVMYALALVSTGLLLLERFA
jgi:AGZA family xanthine/uracil permease-like MFS transporter